jgi:hypothetical protein
VNIKRSLKIKVPFLCVTDELVILLFNNSLNELAIKYFISIQWQCVLFNKQTRPYAVFTFDTKLFCCSSCTVPYGRGKGKGKDHPRIDHEDSEGEQTYSCTLFLNSALDGVGCQLHAPAALPRELPGTHCIGGWVGPRAGLYGCEISRPTGLRSPDRPTRSESPYRPELSRPMYCVLLVSNIRFITKGFLIIVLSFSKTFSYVTEQHLLVSCCRFVVPTCVVFMCMTALALLRDCPSLCCSVAINVLEISVKP